MSGYKIITIMKYYFSKTISGSFDDTIKLVTEGLKTKGFSVITEIRMHEKLKEKLNVDFKKYTIFGACNPSFALKALRMEDKIGVMLPCNVLVIEQAEGVIEVAAINPAASMQTISNPELTEMANEVSQILQSLVEHV
jgi:uncharacterized protein (DUF302 family)